MSPRTTVADPAALVAENRLLGQPAPTAPDRVWVGDTTYLPLVGGRYLATWRDACSRRVVGWHLAAQMPTELVLTALEQALTLRQPGPGLIVHADRGSQYTSAACRQRIEDAGVLTSYSRPGNPLRQRSGRSRLEYAQNRAAAFGNGLCHPRRSPPRSRPLPRHLLQPRPPTLRSRLLLAPSIRIKSQI